MVLHQLPSVWKPATELDWLFGLSIVAVVLMGYGIGANDVANAFGTSVGSGALTIRKAIVIAAVMEFSGAVLMGSQVAQTIRSNIANEACFFEIDPETEIREPQASIFMLLMFCALVSAGIWLLFATSFGLPVSTTHAIIGGIIGSTMVAKGPTCVIWGWKGLLQIIASWFISPVLSGVLGIIFYVVIKYIILRSKNPVERGLKTLPILAGITTWFLLVLILWKSPLTSKVEVFQSLWQSLLITLGGSTLVGLVVWFFGVPWVRSRINYLFPDDDAESASVQNERNPLKKKEGEVKKSLPLQRAEHLFLYLQVMTAAMESFAHGANDTANAIGPLAAIYYCWRTDQIASTRVQIWMLAIGGAAIVLGLATYGQKVMQTIGKKLTLVNYPRGFCIEISSAASVVVASRLGVPVSTTHCQVGSVVGLGIISRNEEDQNKVNWKLFLGIILSWFVTVPFSALVSALLFWCLQPSIRVRF
eukprot:TRINITY_DN7020_c0_g1_i1.p1 TRINITY_DN7020_c0_g1~~TRINITY_DN7020_c0_g1_i1.p1  ORF type:complete len:476 (+),score=52.40 TRINITY_DN7020_c0_g1_i1:74-1501(+)